MPRWIIPSSIVVILVSLAALGILLASNSGRMASDGLGGEAGQVKEPETSPQPAPQQETAGEEESTTPEDQPALGEQTTPQGPRAPGPRFAVIQITGDSAYYCSAGVIGEPKTIEGRRPNTFRVEVVTGGTALDTVMAVCQKISPGTLGVQILYDDQVVARDETTTRLGTVSVSWNPLEE